MNKKQIAKELSNLIAEGNRILFLLIYDPKSPENEEVRIKAEAILKELGGKSLRQLYMLWYHKSLYAVRQLAPERLAEFESYYARKSKKTNDINNYSINDHLLGLVFTAYSKEALKQITITQVELQVLILSATLDSLDSRIKNIEDLLAYELWSDNLSVARQLVKNKLYRPAGALSGVILEQHLQKVCSNHSIKVEKRNPTISDLNELLRNNHILDTPKWRHISRLADIRNYCVHQKEREPDKDEVNDLIIGTEKYVAELV